MRLTLRHLPITLSRMLRRLLEASVLFALASGCGDESSNAGSGGASGCVGDTFSVGLEKPGKAGQLNVVLETADPAPPAKGDNRWTIRVTDSGGAPVSEVSGRPRWRSA